MCLYLGILTCVTDDGIPAGRYLDPFVVWLLIGMLLLRIRKKIPVIKSAGFGVGRLHKLAIIFGSMKTGKRINWQEVTAAHACTRDMPWVKDVLNTTECDALVKSLYAPEHYRKTISMRALSFWAGENIILSPIRYHLSFRSNYREKIYPKLAPIANDWSRVLTIPTVYPGEQVLKPFRLSVKHIS